MTELVSFSKTLNATEAGMTNTNDSYVLIPQRFDASVLYPKQGIYMHRDLISGESYSLRFEITKTNEQRLYKLGVYCRENNVQCGDVIQLERHISEDKSTYFINANRKHNIILLQKHKDGYLIIRNDLHRSLEQSLFSLSIFGKEYRVMIRFDKNIKKRADSPDSLPLYEVLLDGQKDINEVLKSPYIEINLLDKVARAPQDVKLTTKKQ